MRRFGFLFLGLLVAWPALAQTPRTVAGDPQDLRIQMTPLTAVGTSEWFDVTRYNSTAHALTFYVTGGPSAVTVSLQCSNDGGATSTSTIGSNSSTTGGTIAGSALCTHVRANLSVLTGGTNPRIIPVYSNAPLVDPCVSETKSYGNISLTANTQLITGTTAKKVHFCSLNLVAAAATNVAIVAGTGSTCGTNTVAVTGLSGGTTAATGWNLSANGGIAFGNGGSSIGAATVNADNVCILVSAANQISGGYSYVVR